MVRPVGDHLVLRWGTVVLSALLLIGCFAPFDQAAFGWVALVPVWCLLQTSPAVQARPLRHGYVYGLLFFGGVFWWISNVTVVGIIILVAYLSIYPALWFLLVARLCLRKNGPLSALVNALAAASFWVLVEWCRGWVMSGFNWNELGISQATSPVFRQVVAYGGIHLLSFLLVMVNVLWAESLLAWWRRLTQAQRPRLIMTLLPSPGSSACLVMGLLLVVGSFALGFHHLVQKNHRYVGKPLRFACIQPNIPQVPPGSGVNLRQHDEDGLTQLEKMTAEVLRDPPDLIVWPESAIDLSLFSSRDFYEATDGVARAFDGAFVFGSLDDELYRKGELYNAAYSFTLRGDSFEEYRKMHLVVLGEFIPFGKTFPWLHQAIGLGLDMTPGPGPKLFNLGASGHTAQPLICFEDTVPEVADEGAKLQPELFITITNDAWYTGWFAQWGIRQHLNHARFRCIEHDRPMLRCANNGISCVIDPTGEVTQRLRDDAGKDIDIGGVFRGTIRLQPPEVTLHESWGDWIVLISAGISVILSVRLFWAQSIP